MARRSRPVLYEVVRRGERQRQQGWFSRLISSLRGGESSRADGAEDEQDYLESEASVTPVDATAEQHVAPPEAESRSAANVGRAVPESRSLSQPSQPSQPTLHAPVEPPRTASQREPTPMLAFPESAPANNEPWLFTLNRSSIIAVGLGVVLLMFIAFEMGQYTAGPSTVGDDAAGDTSANAPANSPSRSTTRNTAVTSSNSRDRGSVALPDPQSSRSSEEEPLRPATRPTIDTVKSGRYLVVQDLAIQDRSKRLADGQRIVAHLESKGIPAKLIPGRKAPLVIVATPLDGMSDAAIDNLKARVRRAGNDFPGYKFSDCYPQSF